jgi:hypothetical protein
MSSFFSRLVLASVVGILLVSWQHSSAQTGKPASTPDEALKAYRKAIEDGDIKAVAALTAGEPGTTLRKLAEPLARAKDASDRLKKALEEKQLKFDNPFAAGLAPLADMEFALVEMGKEGARTVARIKVGPRGKGQEETIYLSAEGGGWRLDPPADLAKQLRALASTERLERRLKGLDQLARILETVAGEVQNGKLKTSEDILLRLVKLGEEQKLSELLG